MTQGGEEAAYAPDEQVQGVPEDDPQRLRAADASGTLAVGAAEGLPGPLLHIDEDLKRTLAERDITGIYHALQQAGVSQRAIARLTGQHQSEVNEILRGRRVAKYDTLVRIADGLGFHRGLMGLAYVDPEVEGAQERLEEEVAAAVRAARDAPVATARPESAPARSTCRVAWISPDGRGETYAALVGGAWTGLEVSILCRSMGMSTAEFAGHIGVSARKVRDWSVHPSAKPDNASQGLLNSCLRLAPREAQQRFAAELNPEMQAHP